MIHQTREQLACLQCGDTFTTHLLNVDIQQRATFSHLSSAFSGTSNNSKGVGTLGMGADGNYNPSQMQDLINKMDGLINALRRKIASVIGVKYCPSLSPVRYAVIPHESWRRAWLPITRI